MKGLMPLSAVLLSAVMVGGCQDNSAETEKLRGDLTAQQKRFDEANDRWASERDTMRADIEDLKKQLGTLPGEDGKPGTPMADRIKDLEGRVGEVENSPNDELAAKVDALGKKIDGVEEKAVEAARAEVAKAGTGEVDPEALAAALAKQQAENAPTKNLAQALDRLSVSQGEKDMIRQAIIDSKQQILETLEVPTEDGRVLAEELIDTMIKIQNGDAKQSDATAIFLELASKKVPGDIEGRSYMEAINDIKARNREDIGRILSPADQKKLTAAHEDWTDFEVGDGDPFGALYMERVQKYQQEHPDKKD